jgi:mono/diheme cytochrome c family protein
MSSSRIRVALIALALSTSSAFFAMAGHGEKPRAQNTVAAPARAHIAVSPVVVEHTTTRIVASTFDPAKAWVDLGCIGCHGDDGVYSDEIAGALGKPLDQVGRWIRNAPTIKPGTEMPYFASRIDETNSVALARWVQELAAHRK